MSGDYKTSFIKLLTDCLITVSSEDIMSLYNIWFSFGFYSTDLTNGNNFFELLYLYIALAPKMTTLKVNKDQLYSA